MALLYTDSPISKASRPPQLPSVHELPAGEIRELELNRMGHLLVALELPLAVPAQEGDERFFNGRLEELNRKILRALAAGDPETELAYEVGRSLRDTVNPPRDVDDPRSSAAALARQFTRDRVSKLQESLAAVSDQFPPSAAAIVATSIGRWSEFVAVTAGATRPRLKRNGLDEVVVTTRRYLLSQGDLWLMLLIGKRSAAGVLTSEGYVEAGDATLHRASKTLRQVLRHYWVGLVGLAAVTAGFVYLSAANLHGGAKVWTSIAAVAGALGFSARGVSKTVAAVGRAVVGWADQAERPIWTLAEEDAMAWEITTLPPIRLSSRGVWKLRRAGVAPPSSLSRI
jgi:hypothetical protein